MPDPITDGELIRLRNRVTALEANGAELLARAEQAELELKRERAILKMAERHAMKCDANQAAAEAALARAEARCKGLNAHHLRTEADHRAERDAVWERAEKAEARLEHALDELSNLRDHRARWETERARADKAEQELAEAKDAYLAVIDLADLRGIVRHLAAEAHRRKWAHEHSSPAAFDVLHRLGNELKAALDAPQRPEDARPAEHRGVIDPGEPDEGPSCDACGEPYPCPDARESPEDARTGVSAGVEASGGAGEAQEG